MPKTTKPDKESKLEIIVEEAEGRSIICQVCGELHHSEKAVPILRAIDGSGEWVICPECLSAGPTGAARISKERAEDLMWLSKQIRRVKPENWATTNDIQKHELVMRGVVLGLNLNALRKLDVETLRALFGDESELSSRL
jgi:hypothetical protein